MIGNDCFCDHYIVGNTQSIITFGVGFSELPVRIGISNDEAHYWSKVIVGEKQIDHIA